VQEDILTQIRDLKSKLTLRTYAFLQLIIGDFCGLDVVLAMPVAILGFR